MGPLITTNCHPFHSPAKFVDHRSYRLSSSHGELTTKLKCGDCNKQLYLQRLSLLSCPNKTSNTLFFFFFTKVLIVHILLLNWNMHCFLIQKDCIMMRKTLSACQIIVAISEMVPGKAASMFSARKTLRKNKSPTYKRCLFLLNNNKENTV